MLSITSIAGRCMATTCCTGRCEYIILKIVQVSFVEADSVATAAGWSVFLVQDSIEKETIMIAVKIIAILEYFMWFLLNIIKVAKILSIRIIKYFSFPFVKSTIL